MQNYCYILANAPDNTYNGYTNNLQRRIRQHNSEIKGGARCTSGRGPWEYLAIITSNDEAFTKQRALSLEWHIKYPTNKRPRPRQYNGALGRLASLPLVLENPKFADLHFTVYVQEAYLEHVPPSIHALPLVSVLCVACPAKIDDV
jgi:predicted GIY-YIG superfamily endonuclease